MKQRFINNYTTQIASTFGATDTQLWVETPPQVTLGGSEFLSLTLYRLDGVEERGHEVVQVTSINGNMLEVVRSTEGAAASQFVAGDWVSARVTAKAIEQLDAAKVNVTDFTKENLGMDKVQNLAPAEYPVSTAQATELAKKEDKSAKNSVNGYPGLNNRALELKNVDGTATALLRNVASQPTTLNMPGTSGTLARLEDIPPPASSVPMGALIAFDAETKGELLNIPGGNTYLKTGVVADATAYPSMPAGPFGMASTGPISMPFTGSITSVAYGNGMYVVVTNADAKVWASPDLINWTATTLPGGSNVHGIIRFANGVFIFATSTTTPIYRSVDGINWTAVSSALATDYTGGIYVLGITYGAGRWIVVLGGGSSTYYTSTDNGLSWISRALPVAPTFSTTGLTALGQMVVYANNQFVILNNAGGTNSIITSVDGLAWTTKSGLSSGGTSITYGNGMWVMTRYSTASSTTVYSSPDLTTWTARGLAGMSVNTVFGVSYQFGVFLIADATSNTYSSVDGITWVQNAYSNGAGPIAAPPAMAPDSSFALSCTSNVLTRLHSSGTCWASFTNVDFINGTSVLPGSFEYINDHWTMTATSATAYHSWDGKLWWLSKTPIAGNIVPQNGAAYLLPNGTGVCWTSPNGLGSWVSRSTAANGALYHYASANGRLFSISGNSSSFSISVDNGVTWTSGAFSVFQTGGDWREVLYCNGVYLAYSKSPGNFNLCTSADTVTWIARANPAGSTILRIVVANGYFVLATPTGLLFKSADGVNWTALTNYVYMNAPVSFSGMVVDGNKVILTSGDRNDITIWRNDANDSLYRRGTLSALPSVTGHALASNGNGTIAVKAANTNNYGLLNLTVDKIFNDINLKTYDANNQARTDFYKRIA